MSERLVVDGYLVQIVGGALVVHPGCMVGDMFATTPGDEMVIVLGQEWAAALYPLCQHEAEIREIMNGLLWPGRNS